MTTPDNNNKAKEEAKTAGSTPSLFAGFSALSSTGSGGSLFGNLASSSSSSSSPFKTDGSSTFSFAPAAGFGESLMGSSASSSSASASKKKGEDDGDDEEDGEEGGEGATDADEAHAAEFKPLISLPEIVVQTMEEDEDILFKFRAKLFVFVKEDNYGGEVRQNWWRERGLGDAKILKHKTSGKCRFLMRQEKTHKICANHLIQPDCEIKPLPNSEDRAWTWIAGDFADGEIKTHTFALKFKEVETAAKFKETFEEAKKTNASSSGGNGTSTTATITPPKTEESRKSASPAAVPASNAPRETPAVSSSSPSKQPAPTTPSSPGGAVNNVATTMAHKLTMTSGGGMPGGWSKRDPQDPEVAKVAEFAAKQIGTGTLVKVASVKAQVVAGMNYRVALHIRHSRTGEVHAHVATVYVPLPHTKEPMKMTEEVHTGVVS